MAFSFSLVPGSNWVQLPLEVKVSRGWAMNTASQLLPPETPRKVRAGIARQLAFFLEESRKGGAQLALALVLPEKPDTVAALTEMHTYTRDPGQSVEETATWLLTNLAADQDSAAISPPVRERIELQAGPAVRMRATYPDDSNVPVGRIMYAVLPPEIEELIQLSTTWTVPELSDEVTTRADKLAHSLTVQPTQ